MENKKIYIRFDVDCDISGVNETHYREIPADTLESTLDSLAGEYADTLNMYLDMYIDEPYEVNYDDEESYRIDYDEYMSSLESAYCSYNIVTKEEYESSI